MITQAELKRILHYDQLTGQWTWLVKRRYGVEAGSRAGSLDKSTGYWVIVIARKIHKAHRLAYLYMTGDWPAGDLDHKNTIRCDSAWDNLRPASDTQNAQNRSVRSDNQAQLKGASPRRDGRWQAQIQVDGRKQFLGYFDTPDAAHAAYVAAAERHFGEFARRA